MSDIFTTTLFVIAGLSVFYTLIALAVSFFRKDKARVDKIVDSCIDKSEASTDALLGIFRWLKRYEPGKPKEIEPPALPPPSEPKQISSPLL